MAWTSLQNSLGDKPQVIAGPILRKVWKKSVTVWVVTRTAARVDLYVMRGATIAATGSGRTVAIGRNMHIVAVTARPGSSDPWLTEGIVYTYNLEFTFDNIPQPMKLKDATKQAKLAYPSMELPSFTLPPQDLNFLRVLHGSCRMPHAQGYDAMPLIDDLIAATANNAYARPHQLLLMGDQIYADDVADSLLMVLSDAAYTLLGWSETLPVPASLIDPATKLPMPALRHDELRKAGFTSVDLQSHLMSLGEYLCMYLFVWSDVLWPSELPTANEVAVKTHPANPNSALYLLDAEKYRARAAAFATTLWKVRRAMANIPTYMIFDDHDVTDDWNGTLDICRKLYSKPLGLRVMQNALTAYALCQHWGNAPEQFERVDPPPPGAALIYTLDPGLVYPPQPIPLEQRAARYEQDSKAIRSLVGMPENVAEVEQRKAVFHKPGSLQYHFTVEAEGHQIIFTDTRSWRSFPDGGNEPGELLPPDQLDNQILGTDNLRDRALLVVLSTNAPPVQPIRSAARQPARTRIGASFADGDSEPDLFEAWEIPSVAFDRLLKRLTTKLPRVNGELRGQVILLSGDVHHSFATRLIYRAKERFEDLTPQPATAVIAQLVSSSFKKETASTRGFQEDGYSYAPAVAHIIATIPPHQPEGYVGWNVPAGKTVINVGFTSMLPSMPQHLSAEIKFKAPTYSLVKDSLVWPHYVKLTLPPDYRYRLDYLLPLREDDEDLDDAPHIPPPNGASLEERKKAAQDYRTANAYYRLRNRRPGKEQLIGVNNFSEVTFDWGQGDNKAVRHTVRWYQSISGNYATTYLVSLNPNDPNYPDIKDGSNP